VVHRLVWGDLRRTAPKAGIGSTVRLLLLLVGYFAFVELARAPRLTSSQSAYGALGVAATLLFGLYVISRLVVASAIVNVTVWDGRLPKD
jgi:hypothetical protein